MESPTTSVEQGRGVERAYRPATLRRAAALFGLYILFELVALFVLNAASDDPPRIAGVLIHQVVGWPIVLYLAVRGSGRPWQESLPLRAFSSRWILPTVTLCAGLSILLVQVASLLPTPDFVHRLMGQYDNNPWYLLVAVSVVLAPTFEEAFHRGWLLTGLRKRYSTRRAILLSAIAFALFHLNPWQAIGAFPLGLLLAWLVVQTGSLGPSILGHASANAVGEVLDRVLRAMGHTDAGIEEMKLLPPVILVAGALLAITGWFLLKFALNRSAPTHAP